MLRITVHDKPRALTFQLEGRYFMNASKTTARRADEALENFAAELTAAAYSVALRHGLGARWLDLKLELWKVLNEAVKRWDRQALLPR